MIVHFWNHESTQKDPVLVDTIRRINNKYGKGLVKYAVIREKIGTAFIWHGFAPVGTIKFEMVRFSVKDNFVHFRGKKRKLGYVSRY